MAGEANLLLLGVGASTPAAPGGADALLLEDGSSYLLAETGDRILLE